MSITMIGLDTSKSVFQVHGVNETGNVEIRRKLRRSELIPFFEKQQACTVVMEACGAAHHWARVLSSLGHEVKLIAPEAVRPFVKKGKKNDPADAAALCEAASRPDMMFVPIKTIEQQGILALHSARSLLVKQQTMLANAMRGLASEFGLTVPQGIGRLDELFVLVDADKAFPGKARQVFTGLFEQCSALAAGISAFEAEIVAHARHNETARRLATIPGVGPMSRITLSDGLLIAEVDGLPSSASRRAVGIVGSGSGSSDAPSLIKRCAVRSGHQGPVLAVLAMLATKRRLRVALRGCALPLTAAAHGAL